MGCLRCGKKTASEQVFCSQCLASMERYPVKPDVHIQLPNRPGDDYKIVRKRRPPTPEEQVLALRRKIRKLTAWLVLLALALGAAGFFLVRSYYPTPKEDKNWGQNYSTEESVG